MKTKTLNQSALLLTLSSLPKWWVVWQWRPRCLRASNKNKHVCFGIYNYCTYIHVYITMLVNISAHTYANCQLFHSFALCVNKWSILYIRICEMLRTPRKFYERLKWLWHAHVHTFGMINIHMNWCNKKYTYYLAKVSGMQYG